LSEIKASGDDFDGGGYVSEAPEDPGARSPALTRRCDSGSAAHGGNLNGGHDFDVPEDHGEYSDVSAEASGDDFDGGGYVSEAPGDVLDGDDSASPVPLRARLARAFSGYVSEAPGDVLDGDDSASPVPLRARLARGARLQQDNTAYIITWGTGWVEKTYVRSKLSFVKHTLQI
jgi:hypothetical protein